MHKMFYDRAQALWCYIMSRLANRLISILIRLHEKPYHCPYTVQQKLQSYPMAILFFCSFDKRITNGKRASFCIEQVRMSPSNHNPNPLF